MDFHRLAVWLNDQRQVLLPDVQLSRDYDSRLWVTLSQDFNVGAEDHDYQDSSDDVLNVA